MLAPGSWIHSKRPLKWLLDSGHKVFFVDREHPGFQKSNQLKFILYTQTRGKRFYSWLGKPISAFIAKWTIIIQLKLIKIFTKAEITHVHWLNERAYHTVLAKIHPLIVSVLGSDVNKFFESNYREEEKRKVYKVLSESDLVLVDSRDMIEKCQTLSGGKANVILFPIGIDTKKYAINYREEVKKWRSRLGIEKGALILTSIRAMSPKYNQNLIIDAFLEAVPHFNHPAYLLLKDFNSQDDDYKQELRGKISRIDVNSKIRWINEFIPDNKMPVFYALSDLIINFPSYDAFPVSFIEAAAAGKPVLTCDLPAYRDTFAEKYFYYLKQNNVEALKNGLIEMVNNQSKQDTFLRKEMMKWVQENYDEEVSKKNLIKIYHFLSQNKSHKITFNFSEMKDF